MCKAREGGRERERDLYYFVSLIAGKLHREDHPVPLLSL
jgi:hypothetical protein